MSLKSMAEFGAKRNETTKRIERVEQRRKFA